MIPFAYLNRGLVGLANAHRAGTMAGHLGAAVIAGYFFGEDQPDLATPVYQGVQAELDRIIAGDEAIWFDSKKAGLTSADLFTSTLAVDDAETLTIGAIAQALTNNVDQLRESGHNVIFASIGLRALHDHAQLAKPEIIGGIVRLIKAFDGTYGGRGFYGKSIGWRNAGDVPLEEDPGLPRYANIPQMVEATVRELVATAGLKKQGFGGLWHLINHAASITELDRLGYHDFAQRALVGHHQHLRLWRTLPDVADELGPVVPATHDPYEAAYWHEPLKRDEARLTHRIKTLYGFHAIARRVENRSLADQGRVALRCIMG